MEALKGRGGKDERERHTAPTLLCMNSAAAVDSALQ